MSASIPAGVLTIFYGLHMLATVAWVGGLAAFALIVLPAARKGLPADNYTGFLGRISTRLQQVGWFSLVVLVVTGLFQMSAHPRYEGFLAINNTWSMAIIAKHVVIGGMVALNGYLTWFLNPAYQRLALRKAKGTLPDDAQMERLQRREVQTLNLTLAVGVVVLLLTALARVS